MQRFTVSTRVALAMVIIFAAAGLARSGNQVPFKGTWSGQTVSAMPLPDDPFVIAVVSTGTGQVTHLGACTMTSPHFSHLLTGFADGEQHFTAANGDQLDATFAGFFVPTPDGKLAANLQATITGGTGRFAGAAGGYTFSIVFDPATFQSTATIDGVVSRIGH